MTENKKINNQEFIDSLDRTISFLVINDEQEKAYKLLKVLERRYLEQKNEFNDDLKTKEFFENAIAKLQYIALPLLDNEKIVEIIGNSFRVALYLEGYNLEQKWKGKMISILDLKERDDLKEKCRKALFFNKERITPNYNYKTISDWLKNYIERVGLDKVNALQRSQYLLEIRSNKTLSEADKLALLTLISFYNDLNISSLTPQGLEDEANFVYDDKPFIFKKGFLEPVEKDKNFEENWSEFMNLSGLQAADALKNVETSDKNNTLQDSVFTKDNSVEPFNVNEILGKYPPSSLEYKAVKQEIERLRKNKKNAS
ncbi:MAG: hypothetical protein PHG95_04140 [Patescibacteria group bacterium]|nr:hypothetical protein [Patescibacteria group bacterium]